MSNGNSPDPVDSIDFAERAKEEIKAQERAAQEAADLQAVIDRQLGPAANDQVFQDKLRDSMSWNAYRTEGDRLTGYEDALRQGRALYQPEMVYMARNREDASRPRVDRRTAGGQSGLDPRAQMRTDGMLLPLAVDDDGPTGPLGPAGPRSPRLTVQDLLKANLNRLLGSQMQGFDEQRGLAAQLSDLREQGIAGQEQLAQDTAAGREGFLGELDISRAEQGEVERVQRETQKGFELARQQTQLDDALRASGVDKSAAGQRLQSMGIDPGNFADAAQSETTAMLYSQNMSSADVVNQMDMVAQASAQFASNANDQASAAAMFGIGEDLTFAMQAVDQARTQGQIDDAQALQAISDAERNAMQAYDSAITQLDVQTLQAAQAAAARAARAAEKSAAKNEKLAAAALGMQAIEKYRGGGTLTEQDYMNMSIAGMSSDLFDAGSDISDAVTDQAMAAYASMLGTQDYESKLILDQEYGGGDDYIGITSAGYPMTFGDIIDAISAAPESFSGWESFLEAASPAELEEFGYSRPAAP